MPVARVLAGPLRFLIALVWIWSGVQKLLFPSRFIEVVEAHGVVPRNAAGWSVAIIPIELAVGLVLIMSIGWSSAKGKVVVVLLSLLATVGLTGYLLMVPEEVLVRSGCGCHGAVRLQAWPSGTRTTKSEALVINLALLGTHMAALVTGRQGCCPSRSPARGRVP